MQQTHVAMAAVPAMSCLHNRRHDSLHNDIKHNDIQRIDIQHNNIQHNNL